MTKKHTACNGKHSNTPSRNPLHELMVQSIAKRIDFFFADGETKTEAFAALHAIDRIYMIENPANSQPFWNMVRAEYEEKMSLPMLTNAGFALHFMRSAIASAKAELECMEAIATKLAATAAHMED